MTDSDGTTTDDTTPAACDQALVELLRRPRITWSLHLDDRGRSAAAFTSTPAATGGERDTSDRSDVRLLEGQLHAAGHSVACPSTHPDDVCAAFIELISALRRGSTDDITGFRRGDIDGLAAALAIDEREVLDRLARLLGTSAKRRDAMTAAYVAGTSVIPCRDEPVQHGPSLLAQRLGQRV